MQFSKHPLKILTRLQEMVTTSSEAMEQWDLPHEINSFHNQDALILFPQALQESSSMKMDGLSHSY